MFYRCDYSDYRCIYTDAYLLYMHLTNIYISYKFKIKLLNGIPNI